MRVFVLLAGALLAGCAAGPQLAEAPAGDCRAEVAGMKAMLAAEIAQRERMTRAATRREDALRRQLDALKAIERDILQREDRVRFESK